jgi:hypothetical protein
MPLPQTFSPWEHLQDQLRRIHNREVVEYFRDAADDDITTSQGSLKVACKMDDADTAVMTLLRLFMFEFTVGRGRRLEVADLEPSGDLPSYAAIRRNKPIITLFFREDAEDADAGYQRIKGEISFRLMNQTNTTISESEAKAYGRKIKTAFAAGNGFVWKRGKVMCSYTDWEKGYQLQLLARNAAEGKRVVEQVLDIQSHTPDWEYFQVKENDQPSQAFPTVPPRATILNKSKKLPRRRPIADVRYQYATLKLFGVGKAVVIHDRTYRFRSALEK